MSKEKKSASGAKKEKLKKVNEVEDALPQDAEQKLSLIEDTTESTAEKAEVAVKQAEKLGGKDAYEKLKALIAEMEVPEKTKEVFQKSLEDFTNLKNNIANNAQDKDLLIKEIDGIINKLNTKIEILTKTESTENPADSVSIEVNPDAPEPEKEPKPKKTRTRTKKETPTENTAPAETLTVGDTVELDPTITTPPVIAVAPDAPGATEAAPALNEAEIEEKINQEIANAQIGNGGKELSSFEKKYIALRIITENTKPSQSQENPTKWQKIRQGAENWWLNKNTGRTSKVSLAVVKAGLIIGGSVLTSDVEQLGRGSWRVISAVATSFLSDNKTLKEVTGRENALGDLATKTKELVQKFKDLERKKQAVVIASGLLASALVAGGAVAVGAMSASSAGIGLAGAGARYAVNWGIKYGVKKYQENKAKNFDIKDLMANHEKAAKEFKNSQRFQEYTQSFANLVVSTGVADASAAYHMNQNSLHQTAEHNQTISMGKKSNIFGNIKNFFSGLNRSSSDKIAVDNSNENENLFSNKNLAEAWGDRPKSENLSSEPTVDDINSEMSQLKNQISRMSADEEETKNLLIQKFDELSEQKHQLVQAELVRNETKLRELKLKQLQEIQNKVTEQANTEIMTTLGDEEFVSGKNLLHKEDGTIVDLEKEPKAPKLEKIEGMDPKFVVDKGLGVTHAFREQVGADAKLGSALADQIGYEGKVGTPAFYKALGQHFGYIDKNGDEVRVKWGGEKGMAAYQFIEGEDGKYGVQESHLDGNEWIKTESKGIDREIFEAKTDDHIENKEYNPKETHDYEYLHERKVRGPILKETSGPKETIPTGPKQEEIIPVAKKEEVLLKEEVVSRPEPAPKERVRIVRQAPQGNGTVKAGYVTGGDYMANADYGARGDNTSPYPNFPGGMPPGMEMYNFTPQEVMDIQAEAGSLSEARSEVLQKMMMNVARNPNLGPNLPVIVYQDIALKGETEMNADLNKIMNGGGSYLANKEWNEMQGNRVAKFVEDNLNTPGDKGQLAKYIRNLENASGLEPKEGAFRHEKVGEFIRRAHADLAIKEMRGEFDYRNLSVPGEVKAPVIEAEANEAGDESNSKESNENTNQAEKIDFNKTEMYELWDTYTNDPSALTQEGRDFAGKVASLRRQLGSSFPSIGNSETAQHYLERLEKAANK